MLDFVKFLNLSGKVKKAMIFWPLFPIIACSNVKKESCFFPIPQAAECILQTVEKVDAPVIYLSTDAAESETNLLQSLVVLNDKQVPLVKRPGHNSAEKWDALLYRNRLGGDSQVNLFAWMFQTWNYKKIS